MHYCVRARAGKRSLNLFAIGQIAFDELRSRIHCAAMALAEIIEDRSVMAFIKKKFCANATDITSADTHENLPALAKCSVPSITNKRSVKRSLLLTMCTSIFSTC